MRSLNQNATAISITGVRAYLAERNGDASRNAQAHRVQLRARHSNRESPTYASPSERSVNHPPHCTTKIPTIHKANPPRTEAEKGGQPSAEEVAEDCPCQNGPEVGRHLPFPDQNFEAQFWKELHLSQPKWDFEAEERLEKERGEREEEVKRSEREKNREEEEEEDDRDQMARTLTGFFLGFGSDWCGG